ncbi:hypothetical protein HG530_007773 [Fusarium avenaceum]|nr:hypothetical protein HG530_007773 [Fusarium avenaceum]
MAPRPLALSLLARRTADKRLLALHSKIEKERGLLEGVSTMGNNNALDVRTIEICLDAMRQRGKDSRVDVAAINIGDLHASNIRDIADLRDRVNQRLDAQRASLVACGLVGRSSRAGNGTAGGIDGDVGQAGVEALEAIDCPGDKPGWLWDRRCKG